MNTAGPVTLGGKVVPPDQMFRAIVAYIQAQHALVEPLYQLEKERALTADSEFEEQGKVFLRGQVVVGAQMLGDLWVSAWKQAPADTYLLRQLSGRKHSSIATEP
jgi:hypothetical protein